MTALATIDSGALCRQYLESVDTLLTKICEEESDALERAATRIAEHISKDRIVYIFGPGGHSNLAAQEIFFRAGGLTHISAILDEGTMLSGGALRSTSIERTLGYGKAIIADQSLGPEDLLILVNAYGVNTALIDAAIEARQRGVYLIGLSSRMHAVACPHDHPARHPTKLNLHDLVDIAIDTKIPIGDALQPVPGVSVQVGAASTFSNAFALQCLVIRTVAALVRMGVDPPIWHSNYSPGGDQVNRQHGARLRNRISWL